ncbi:MAG TPA: nucleotidyl transferase AbiEii/AbiGii toxin family protein [Kofleriaceae bacterium]|jgi:hypothetical protein
MDSSPSKLTLFQLETLRAFFSREQQFFLTGGAALAGFYLKHRLTDDLDLFTTDDDAFGRGRYVLEDVAASLGGRVEIRQQAPRFLRAVLVRGDDGVVVDLVRDGRQLHAEKPVIDEIRIDAADEILVNKLTTLIGRAEERDLVDVLFLERSGLRIEDALPAALDKDGGCTPAALAWVLSEISIPPELELPGGVSAAEMRTFVDDLIVRLRRAALPT